MAPRRVAVVRRRDVHHVVGVDIAEAHRAAVAQVLSLGIQLFGKAGRRRRLNRRAVVGAGDLDRQRCRRRIVVAVLDRIVQNECKCVGRGQCLRRRLRVVEHEAPRAVRVLRQRAVSGELRDCRIGRGPCDDRRWCIRTCEVVVQNVAGDRAGRRRVRRTRAVFGHRIRTVVIRIRRVVGHVDRQGLQDGIAVAVERLDREGEGTQIRSGRVVDILELNVSVVAVSAFIQRHTEHHVGIVIRAATGLVGNDLLVALRVDRETDRVQQRGAVGRQAGTNRVVEAVLDEFEVLRRVVVGAPVDVQEAGVRLRDAGGEIDDRILVARQKTFIDRDRLRLRRRRNVVDDVDRDGRSGGVVERVRHREREHVACQLDGRAILHIRGCVVRLGQRVGVVAKLIDAQEAVSTLDGHGAATDRRRAHAARDIRHVRRIRIAKVERTGNGFIAGGCVRAGLCSRREVVERGVRAIVLCEIERGFVRLVRRGHRNRTAVGDRDRQRRRRRVTIAVGDGVAERVDARHVRVGGVAISAVDADGQRAERGRDGIVDRVGPNDRRDAVGTRDVLAVVAVVLGVGDDVAGGGVTRLDGIRVRFRLRLVVDDIDLDVCRCRVRRAVRHSERERVLLGSARNVGGRGLQLIRVARNAGRCVVARHRQDAERAIEERALQIRDCNRLAVDGDGLDVIETVGIADRERPRCKLEVGSGVAADRKRGLKRRVVCSERIALVHRHRRRVVRARDRDGQGREIGVAVAVDELIAELFSQRLSYVQTLDRREGRRILGRVIKDVRISAVAADGEHAIGAGDGTIRCTGPHDRSDTVGASVIRDAVRVVAILDRRGLDASDDVTRGRGAILSR